MNGVTVSKVSKLDEIQTILGEWQRDGVIKYNHSPHTSPLVTPDKVREGACLEYVQFEVAPKYSQHSSLVFDNLIQQFYRYGFTACECKSEGVRACLQYVEEIGSMRDTMVTSLDFDVRPSDDAPLWINTSARSPFPEQVREYPLERAIEITFYKHVTYLACNSS